MVHQNTFEKKLNKQIGHKKPSAGFTNPPSDYFKNFADTLPLDKTLNERPKLFFHVIKRNIWQISSLAAAAVLLIALWIFVFDTNSGKNDNIYFTIEELMALNDFNNYDEDLLYSELSGITYSNTNGDDELNILLEMNTFTADEIINFYSGENNQDNQ